MNTKVLMGSSAVVMGIAGAVALFMPQELLAALGVPAAGLPTALVQLHAGLLLAFAMLNWMAKDSLIGGIYNRPVLVGNLTHFAIGAITLLKLVVRDATPAILVATGIYVVFAIGFGMLMFRSPVQ